MTFRLKNIQRYLNLVAVVLLIVALVLLLWGMFTVINYAREGRNISPGLALWLNNNISMITGRGGQQNMEMYSYQGGHREPVIQRMAQPGVIPQTQYSGYGPYSPSEGGGMYGAMSQGRHYSPEVSIPKRYQHSSGVATPEEDMDITFSTPV